MDILNEILQAEKRIKTHIVKTPLLKSEHLSEISDANVYLKLESEQLTGAFKNRGAVNKILSLSEEELEKGVVTASTGNHGKAVSRALSIVKGKGIVFVPENAAEDKLKAIKEYDVEIKHHGNSVEITELYAKEYAKKNNMTWVSAYDDEKVVGGQGTIGIELLEQLKDIDVVFVIIGGGGLISGISTYLKNKSPNTKIIGCMPENSPEMYLSVKAGKCVTSEPKETLSSASAGGFEEDSITFPICQKLVDEFVLASEAEIQAAMKLVYEKDNKKIEGASAVGVAAFIKQKDKYKGKNIVIIISGGNISDEKFKKIIE